jgi:5-methyltetrahydropteroyltriglutamate--homocysteine methyltransferase
VLWHVPATKDLMLPATVTGSWPRPRWYNVNLWGRPLDTAMMDPWFREQFTDAHALVVSDQARAGLDIVTTGDYHLDEDVAGRSWHHYPLQRWKGLEHEELQTEKTRSPLLSYPVGTMLDSIYKTWRWPRVVGKVEHDPRNPLEYAKIWRISQQAAAATGRPVKFGTCSAQVLAFFLDSHTTQYDLDDKRPLIWDMAEAMNKELRQLAAAGCRVIQVEEPTLHFMARYNPEQKEFIDFLVDAFNREVEGLDDVEIWIHTCWGNPNMQRVIDNDSYRESFELYLEACRGDVWTIETKDRNMREVELFAPFKGRLKKKICVGVVSHRTLQVEQPAEVAASIRHALKHISPEQLIVSSDCGFGRQGCNREIAFFKTAAIAQGANLVRHELGLPEMPIRAAEPALQTDIVPQTPDR